MKFGIEKFRVFYNYQEFNLSPITVLTGPNNSGKSTLQKAIYLMKNSFIGTSDKFALDTLKFDGISKKIGVFENNISFNSESQDFSFSFLFDSSNYNNSIKITLGYELERLKSVKLFYLLEKDYKLLFEITPDNQTIFSRFDIDFLIKIIHFYKKRGMEQNRILDLSRKLSNPDYHLTQEEKNEIEEFKNKFGLEINSTNYTTQDISVPFDWRVYNCFEKHDQKFNKIFEKSLNVFTTSFNDLVIGSVLLDDINDLDYFNTPNQDHPKYERIKSMLTSENIFTEEGFIEKYKDIEKAVLVELILYWNRTLNNVVKTPDGQDYFFSDDLNRIFSNSIENGETQCRELFTFMNYRFNDNLFINYIQKNENWGSVLKASEIEKIRFYKPVIEGAVNDSVNVVVSIINELWKEAKHGLNSFVTRTELFLFDNDNVSKRHIFFDDTKTYTLTLSKFAKEKEAGNISSSQLEFISYWLKEFNLANDLEFEKILVGEEWIGVNYYLKLSGKRVPLNDDGLGANKLVLIILQLVLSNRNSLFLFEEPEIGLHPAFQSKLAELFLDAYKKFGHNFIIETHSEYIIRKFQYLTAKKKLKPEDSTIYYFHHPDNIPKGEKHIKEIGIREDGGLTDDFGPGFFDEATNIKFDLLRLKNSQSN